MAPQSPSPPSGFRRISRRARVRLQVHDLLQRDVEDVLCSHGSSAHSLEEHQYNSLARLGLVIERAREADETLSRQEKLNHMKLLFRVAACDRIRALDAEGIASPISTCGIQQCPACKSRTANRSSSAQSVHHSPGQRIWHMVIHVPPAESLGESIGSHQAVQNAAQWLTKTLKRRLPEFAATNLIQWHTAIHALPVDPKATDLILSPHLHLILITDEVPDAPSMPTKSNATGIIRRALIDACERSQIPMTSHHAPEVFGHILSAKGRASQGKISFEHARNTISYIQKTDDKNDSSDVILERERLLKLSDIKHAYRHSRVRKKPGDDEAKATKRFSRRTNRSASKLGKKQILATWISAKSVVTGAEHQERAADEIAKQCVAELLPHFPASYRKLWAQSLAEIPAEQTEEPTTNPKPQPQQDDVHPDDINEARLKRRREKRLIYERPDLQRFARPIDGSDKQVEPFANVFLDGSLPLDARHHRLADYAEHIRVQVHRVRGCEDSKAVQRIYWLRSLEKYLRNHMNISERRAHGMATELIELAEDLNQRRQWTNAVCRRSSQCLTSLTHPPTVAL